MNRLFYGIFALLIVSSMAFGCRVTFINDTNFTVFAFDDGENTGNILEPDKNPTQDLDKKQTYGEKGRHPMVTLYFQTPGTANFRKAYKVSQKACALHDEDKIIRFSAVIADNGTISNDIYDIRNFEKDPEILTCCDHNGMDHEKMVDQPLTSMDEE